MHHLLSREAAAPREAYEPRVSFATPYADAVGMNAVEYARLDEEALGRPTTFDSSFPRTYAEALKNTSDAVVVTEAQAPFKICHVNDAWVRLCGFSQQEAVGKTLAMLQGPETAPVSVASVVDASARGHATAALLTNYTKAGAPFANFLRVYPLSEGDDGRVTHLLGVLQDVDAPAPTAM